MQEIQKTIKHYGMIRKGDRIVVAVSGGADSVFLLHVLNCIKKKLGVDLYIAHLDHGTRGAESRRDESGKPE